MRVNDSSLFDIADGRRNDTFAPPKGLAVRLGPRRMLLQSEGASAIGVPSGPVLLEPDGRSDVGPDALDGLAAQTYRLGHANWRAFNANPSIAHPVSAGHRPMVRW
jgi:hypothetical protein